MKKKTRSISINRKIILFTSMLVVTIGWVTALSSYVLQNQVIADMLQSNTRGQASLWSTAIPKAELEAVVHTGSSNNRAYQSLMTFMKRLNMSISNDMTGYLIRPDMKSKKVMILTDSDTREISTAFKNYTPDESVEKAIVRAMETRMVTNSDIYKDIHGKRVVTAFAPIFDTEGNILSIFAIDEKVSAVVFNNLAIYFLIGFLVLLSILTIYLIRNYLRKLLKPMEDLMRGINEVSKGNFDVTLKGNKDSELGQLIDQFNFMTTQLHALFEQLSTTSMHMRKHDNLNDPIRGFDEAIKEMEHILSMTKLEKELQQAEKMNAIGQLAASVAHEIRNPITVVNGFLQLFLSYDNLSSTEKTYVKLMMDEINRAEAIINDYLSLAKPDLESKQYIQVEDFATNIMELMNGYSLMSKNIHMNLGLDYRGQIYVNSNELKQVLVNIIKNGIEAIREGGEITFFVTKKGKDILFSITDTGIGMTQQEINRLGTAFYSLKEKGTGIGLMVCYQIIERMKGSIEVYSQIGEGTTFIVKIPCEET